MGMGQLSWMQILFLTGKMLDSRVEEQLILFFRDWWHLRLKVPRKKVQCNIRQAITHIIPKFRLK